MEPHPHSADLPQDLCTHYTGPGVCIPIYWHRDKPQITHQQIRRAIDGLHLHEHATLHHMAGIGHDLNHLVRVMQVTDRYNAYSARETGHKPQTTSYQVIAATGTVPDFAGTFDATRARITRLAEDFTQRMATLNEKQILFYNAVGKDAKVTAKTAYQAAYRDAMAVINHQTKLAFLAEDTHYYLRTANHALKMGVRKGVWINDLKDVQTLKRIATYGKWLGYGIYGFTVVKDFRDVMITRKDGGDWKKETAEDIGELVGQVLAAKVADIGLSEVVAVFIPGIGWGLLGVSIGLELLSIIAGGDIGRWFGQTAEQHFIRH